MWVFSLYSSTQTGQYSDTKAGFSIFSNPRLIIVIAVLFGAVGFIAYSEFSKVGVQDVDSKDVFSDSSKNVGVPVNVSVSGGGVPNVKLGRGSHRQVIDFVGIFKGADLIIDGYGEVFGKQILTINVVRASQKRPLVLNEVALNRMGYQIFAYSPCYIVLKSVDAEFFATCYSPG